MSSVKSTCSSQEIEPRTPSTRYIDCERLCKKDPKCKFVFYIPDAHCLKYPSCFTTKVTANVGSTYSKNGYCPGSITLDMQIISLFLNSKSLMFW